MLPRTKWISLHFTWSQWPFYGGLSATIKGSGKEKPLLFLLRVRHFWLTWNSGLLCSHSKISARSDPEGTEIQWQLSFSLPTWKTSESLSVCPKAARNSWEGDERLELWGFWGIFSQHLGVGCAAMCCPWFSAQTYSREHTLPAGAEFPPFFQHCRGKPNSCLPRCLAVSLSPCRNQQGALLTGLLWQQN